MVRERLEFRRSCWDRRYPGASADIARGVDAVGEVCIGDLPSRTRSAAPDSLATRPMRIDCCLYQAQQSADKSDLRQIHRRFTGRLLLGLRPSAFGLQ
jgi:hypothetical protein